jgi:uncharacterized protein
MSPDKTRRRVTSRYNIVIETEDGGYTVYNSKTGAITHFDADERRTVTEILHTGKRLHDEIYNALAAQGHLVFSDTDEYASVLNKRQIGVKDRNRLDVIVLPTMTCNFDCAYCYEKKRNEFMDADTTERIGKFLEQRIHDFRLTLLHWFGGEPLLHTEPILEITARAVAAGKRSGMRVVPQMTTNGYLLDKNCLCSLIDTGIKDFQVTLDGHRETHDRMRPLLNGASTYDRIIENCRALLDFTDTQLSLRVNFNADNYTNVDALLREFDPAVRSRIRFVLEPIFGEKEISARGTMPSDTIIGFMRGIYVDAAKMGYGTTAAAVNLIPAKLVYCYAERENQYIFSPKGDVFKCSVQDFLPNDREGRIEQDGNVVWEEGYERWMSMGESFAPVCRDCVYLPLCMGGCRNLQRRLSNGAACSLVATNAARVLQMIDGHGLEEYIAALH